MVDEEIDFKTVFEGLPGKILLLEPKLPFKILAVSKELLNLIGRKREDIIGNNIIDFYRANTAGTSLRELERTVEVMLKEEGAEEVIIARFKRNKMEDLSQPFSSATNKIIRSENGEPLYVIQSITHLNNERSGKVQSGGRENESEGIAVEDKKESFIQLEQSERNLRNLILQAPIAICIFRGPNYIVEIANDLMLKSWDKKAEDVWNKPVYNALPEARGQGFEDLLHRVYTTGETITAYEVAGTLTRNGIKEIYYVDLVYQALREPDGTISGIMIINIDVTEQALSRKKIEEAEERARLAVESAEQGTYEVNLVTDELFASPRLAAIFDIEGIAGRSRYISAIHPDDLKIREEAFGRAFNTGSLEYEVRVIKKDGSITWIRAKGKVYFNEHNQPARLLGVVQDITAEKEINRQKDDFISIVSHELKTPITSLKGYTQILNRKFEAANDIGATSMLAKMNEQVKKLHFIVQDLLDVTRIEGNKIKFRNEEFKFDELVIQTVEDMQRATVSHSLIVEYTDEITVSADKERTSQVLVNLLSNAINYSSKGNKVIVRTYLQSNEIVCGVRDFGLGIEKHDQNRIFERYYRASDENRFNAGLGLGLFISAEIVRRQNGRIWVESEPGSGATFYFSLPV
ncbi:PAS domain-containing sensor histidine kinase [Desertivirga brevis]|uniref:PAS domain-containing sensor histidine kinase n=1 Tax=Desertivirga brevis TaxID=2810310 RepID=UPI001A960D26|nr:PAS domain-containing sensor histidine kinase [Pedobacter sp. SYSU D00873]